MDCVKSLKKALKTCWPRFLLSLVTVALGATITVPVWAMDVEIAGKPLKIGGFINQGIGYGIAGDEYDNQEGFQSFKYDFLLEGEYEPNRNLKFFVSGMLSGDWAYDLLNDNSDWKNKDFNGSRSALAHDTDFRDLLQEAHVTWCFNNLILRIGKQVVAWGETDGFRLMDQINPVDLRRGITDVEFESSILPIWMLKAEYYFDLDSSWLQDLGLEFILNPNADFQANRNIIPGNERTGIWAPDIPVALGPGMVAHLGSIIGEVDEPDNWDPDDFQYGIRLRSVAMDTIITLNYFYGIDNDPVGVNIAAPPVIEGNAFDNQLVIHPQQDMFYPRFQFFGLTMSRDFEQLNSSFLGGVAPVFRTEAFYAKDSTFSTTLPPGLDHAEKHDEFRFALGVDWKIKIPVLNPRAYYLVSAQFYNRHIFDYPSGYNLNISTVGPVKENNYQTSFMVSTTYFHNKLEPSIFWLADHTYDSGFLRPQLKYEYSDKWNFTLGAIFIYGDEPGTGYQQLDNKDHIYFTAAYRF